MPTVKPTAVSANTQLLTWMNKFNDLLSYSSLWDGGQLAKLTDDAGLVFPLASGGNLNNLKGSSTKNYVPANAVNSPLAVAGVVDVDVVDANNATQIFTTLGTGAVRKFSRNLVSGSWTAWTEYASTSLASTSNAGLMSPTDKSNMNTLLAGQVYKLTDNDGRARTVASETDLNTLVEAGTWMVSTQVNSPFPGTSYWYFVEVLKHNGSYVTQRATRFASGSDVRTYTRQMDAGIWLPWRRSVDTNLLSTIIMGNKLVDLIYTNLANKVSGSTVVNPHIVRQTAYSVPRDPSLAGSELPDTLLNRLYSLDGSVQTYANSTAGTMVTQTYSFNILEHLQRTYGTVPGSTLADKVAWVKANTTKFIFSWWGYGSTVGGNKVYVSAWSVPTSSWLVSGAGYSSHSSGTVTKITSSNTNTDVRVDNNGFAHFVVYTDVSDGNTASSISTDYVELQIEVSTDIKTNIPLATATSDGSMSKTDKAALDNSQKWKLTQNDGYYQVPSENNFNNITTPGYYRYNTPSVQSGSPTGGGYWVVHVEGYDTQNTIQVWKNVLSDEIYFRRRNSDGSWKPYKKLNDTSLIANTLLGNKFVDQSIANFIGKVSGSTTANPHYVRGVSHLTSLASPTQYVSYGDMTQTGYNNSISLDGTSTVISSAISGGIAHTAFAFNLIEHVQRTYGTIPGATTADKVAWLKSNLSKLTFNWFGFGSSPAGNKATVTTWAGSNVTPSWAGAVTHNSGSVSKLTYAYTGVAGNLSPDGFVHFLAYAEPSDGVTASVINTDYAELNVELSTDLWNAAKPQWVTATLQNSWVESDSTQTPKFTLGKDGFVDMVGGIKSGTLGVAVMTLPAGYRPTKTVYLSVAGSEGNLYRMTISTAGSVVVTQSIGTAGNSFIAFDGVRFPTL